jgi:hypothetical protein
VAQAVDDDARAVLVGGTVALEAHPQRADAAGETPPDPEDARRHEVDHAGSFRPRSPAPIPELANRVGEKVGNADNAREDEPPRHDSSHPSRVSCSDSIDEYSVW